MVMTSSVKQNNSNPAQDLELVYQISKYIQSHVTDNSDDTSGKPYSNYSPYFKSGPNAYGGQTARGLVLKIDYFVPSDIHTPYGRWSILGGGSGDWDKVLDAIKEPLGLVLMQTGETGSLWAITKWKEREIEMATFRTSLGDHIPRDKVKTIWKDFAPKHPDLAS